MAEVSPSLEGCSPDRKTAETGRPAEELAPLQEPGSRSPPLAWECDRILEIPRHRTPSLLLPARAGDYAHRT